MITTLLLLAMLQTQAPGLAAGSAPDTNVAAVRTEKLTPAEVKAMADANKAVADAQSKLIQAKAALQGTTEGIEQAHHANTDCGCYVESEGRDYDKVEFKGDTIVIHHIHEAPASLTKKDNAINQRGKGCSSRIEVGFTICRSDKSKGAPYLVLLRDVGYADLDVPRL